MSKKTDIRSVLEAEELSEYTELLLNQGLTDVSDLSNVTEGDLKEMGIDKVFHRRKLLKLGGHTTVSISEPEEEGGRKLGGDRVRVEVLAARANNGTLPEREFYVKGALCTFVNKNVHPIGTGQKTIPSRGPFPVWGSEKASPVFEFETDFRSHCISFELKEKRLISDNKVIGVVIFPPKFFHKFNDATTEDQWWPLRLAYEEEGEVHAYLRLRFSVPGGCPAGAKGRIFHVKGVSMSSRKLRVTLFEGRLGSKTNPNQLYGEALLAERAEDKPNIYAQVELDNEEKTVWRTAVQQHTTTPAFDETFEYFAEVQQAKLLTIRLKQVVRLGSDVTLGVLKIPVQFFLCQKDATDVDEVHALYDEKDPQLQVGKLHVRLEVRQRQGSEKRVSFRRTRSIKEEVKRTDSPAFEDELGTVLVDDGGATTTDDEDAASL